jgi:beta-lactamase class A
MSLREKLVDVVGIEKIQYSFYIKDLRAGCSCCQNEHEVVSSASTIKLPVMAEVMRQVKEGMLCLDQRIAVSEEEKVDYSILQLLSTGNSYSLLDVVTLMIIQSDNTAANFLIDLVGMDAVNRTIARLGMKNTQLQRKMLDFTAKKERRDNLTSAYDMAHFLELLYNGKVVDATYDALMVDIMKHQLDRSMVYVDIPDDVVVAHKTGDLDCSNHEVGVFYTTKGDYIFSMLTWNAESNNHSRKVVARAAKETFDYWMIPSLSSTDEL